MKDDRFRGVTDVFTLSDVYFNRRGTLALTSVSSLVWLALRDVSVEGARKE